MKCEPTKVPSIGEIDIRAMRDKYRQERDRRLRAEGQAQYVEPVERFLEAYESDPHMPVQPREPIVEESDWVRTIHETAADVSSFARDCTPGYYNNEGEEKLRWYLGEPYGPGYYAFEALLEEWRSAGDMAGLELNTAG